MTGDGPTIGWLLIGAGVLLATGSASVVLFPWYVTYLLVGVAFVLSMVAVIRVRQWQLAGDS